MWVGEVEKAELKISVENQLVRQNYYTAFTLKIYHVNMLPPSVYRMEDFNCDRSLKLTTTLILEGASVFIT